MTPEFSSRYQTLCAEVRRLLAPTPQCHGWDHTERVVMNARRMLHEAPAADAQVVLCAALLHDIGRAEEFADAGKTCHAARGAEWVPAIMQRAGFDDAAFIAHVTECVRTHRYRRKATPPPATIEAEIVYDADKLDSLGAIGIARAFHFAGRVGARVHNTREDALNAPAYGPEDTAWREYLVKLRHLPDAMQTEIGRQLATERLALMTHFFRRLEEETANPHSFSETEPG